MDCSVSKISGLIIETELPLLKIQTEIISSLFCWNLKPIKNGIFVAIYKIAIFTPKFFNNLLNCLFFARNKYFINYAFLDKYFSFKNKFKYTHLNIFHITYINSNNIQQTLTICIAYRLYTTKFNTTKFNATMFNKIKKKLSLRVSMSSHLCRFGWIFS